MSKVAGVGSVSFDCKTATIKMKAGTLTRAAIETALKGAGFGVAEVTEGGQPTFTVLRATLKQKGDSGGAPDAKSAALPPATSAQLAADLQRELPAIQELFLEPDGRVTVLLRATPPLDEAGFAGALEKRKVQAEGLESKHWPQSAAACVATLRKLDDAEARLRARAAIEQVEGVLAALADSGERFVVFTREPCASLEAKLKAALPPAGFELALLETRAPAR